MPFPETFPCLLCRAIPTLGVVRADFRDTFRDLRIACNSRSTPFLNIHWHVDHSTPARALRLMTTPFRMLDKTEQTGSPLQFVNGLILMSTFAGARLVYGSIIVRTLPCSIYASID